MSVEDVPRSETVARSGAVGALGAVVSSTSDIDVPLGEIFPAASVSVAVTDQVPSDRVGKSHDVAGPTT